MIFPKLLEKAVKKHAPKPESWSSILLMLFSIIYLGCMPCHKFDKGYMPLDAYFDKSASTINTTPLTSIKTNYISTDTFSGIEIDYYHYEGGNIDHCVNFKFFARIDSVQKIQNIFDFFSKNPVSVILFNELPMLSPDNYCGEDSFYYVNNHIKYVFQNFSNVPSQPVYKLSNSEFVKVFKVHGIMDKFSGNLKYNRLAFPLLEEAFFSNQIWQFQYRKIFSRTAIQTQNPFGLKISKGKSITECHMIYH